MAERILVAVVISYHLVERGILARALESVAAQKSDADTELKVYAVD